MASITENASDEDLNELESCAAGAVRQHTEARVMAENVMVLIEIVRKLKNDILSLSYEANR
jgi:hypothetical protein